MSSRMQPCALPRRLAAMLYDGLLIVALWMAATAIVVLIRQAEVQPANPFFQFYLLTVAWLYLAISWRAGQSVGMRAWRMRLIPDTGPVTWLQTLTRFLVAILSWAALGLGFLWSLFHPQKSSWHDLASHSRLVVISK
ncbi:MAG: RDD family protein [Wenzhouxiangella sp.]|nr:RDD family protein [Wenzhouxiangella sp.]